MPRQKRAPTRNNWALSADESQGEDTQQQQQQQQQLSSPSQPRKKSRNGAHEQQQQKLPHSSEISFQTRSECGFRLNIDSISRAFPSEKQEENHYDSLCSAILSRRIGVGLDGVDYPSQLISFAIPFDLKRIFSLEIDLICAHGLAELEGRAYQGCLFGHVTPDQTLIFFSGSQGQFLSIDLKSDGNSSTIFSLLLRLYLEECPLVVHAHECSFPDSRTVKIKCDLLVATNLPYPSLMSLYGIANVPLYIAEKLADQELGNVLAECRHNLPDVLFQPPGLTCNLFPFQQKTVFWMLRREGVTIDEHGNLSQLDQTGEEDPGIMDALDPSKIHLKMDIFTEGLLSSDSSVNLHPGQICFGGMLCEEMGLGKTLEVISVILCHKDTDTDNEIWNSNDGLVRSGATLLIAPSPILAQWQSELQIRAPSLRVKVYNGIQKETDDEYRLAGYDVILSDYSALKSELLYVLPDHSRSRRFDRKYARPISPLKKIHFWRICIDEVQMIDRSSSVGRLMSLLHRRNSWAITGTPVQKSPSHDLLSICGHINAESYGSLVKYPRRFKKLIEILMMRHTKDEVADEIHIPPLNENTVLVKFSPIERHFYNDIRLQLLTSISREVLRGQVERTDYDRNLLLEFLLRLRQTCAHMQVGRINQEYLGGLEKKVQTLDEALQIMVSQTRAAVLHLERQQLSLKIKEGLHSEMRKSFEKAIEIYRLTSEEIDVTVRILREKAISEESADLLKSSAAEESRSNLNSWLTLQHQVLFCLGCVLLEMQQKEESDNAFQQAETVRKDIMSKIEEQVQEEIQSVKAFIEDSQFESKITELSKISQIRSSGIVLPFHIDDINSLIKWLHTQSLELKTYRSKILSAIFRDLHQDYSTDAAIQDLGHICHGFYQDAVKERRYAISGPFYDEYLREPEFKHKRKPLSVDTRVESEKEDTVEDIPPECVPPNPPSKAIKKIWLRKLVETLEDKRQSQSSNGERAILEEAVKRLKHIIKEESTLLVICEKEIAQLGKLWNKRIAFYKSLQKLSDDVAIPIVADLERAENDRVRLLAQSSRALDLERSKLRFLESRIDSDREGAGIDSCLICQEDFQRDTKVAIAKCGHLFCKDCMIAWLANKRNCPLCKASIRIGIDVKFVDAKEKVFESPFTSASFESPKDTVGPLNHSRYPFPAKLQKPAKSFGAKIDLMISHIKHLIDQEPYEFKCLLFSQWSEVLAIFEHALESEGIRYLNFASKAGRKTHLNTKEIPKAFKNDPLIKVMLMNSKSQSAGLTLVNANHVFLVEPALNTATELQAVGRIYRLGQRHETWVHRYIVEDSIEESIFKSRGEQPFRARSEEEQLSSQRFQDEISGDALLYLLNAEVENIVLE